MEKSVTCQGRGRMTIKEKKEILRKVESIRKDGKVSMSHTSTALNLSRSTLLSIISKKRTIEAAPESEQDRYRARNQRIHPNRGKAKYLRLEETLLTWVKEQQASKQRILGSSVRTKALTIAKELGFNDFTASNGWRDRFKKKYGLEYKRKKNVCIHQPETENNNIPPEDFLDVVIKECSDAVQPRTAAKYELMSKYLQIWISIVESRGAQVSGALLKEMGFALAGALGVESFTGSNGWIHKFQLRRMQQKYNSCRKCNESATPDLITSEERTE